MPVDQFAGKCYFGVVANFGGSVTAPQAVAVAKYPDGRERDEQRQARTVAIPRASYNVSSAYDWLLFLLPPALALLLGYLISDTWFSDGEIAFAGLEVSLGGVAARHVYSCPPRDRFFP